MLCCFILNFICQIKNLTINLTNSGKQAHTNSQPTGIQDHNQKRSNAVTQENTIEVYYNCELTMADYSLNHRLTARALPPTLLSSLLLFHKLFLSLRFSHFCVVLTFDGMLISTKLQHKIVPQFVQTASCLLCFLLLLLRLLSSLLYHQSK